LSKKANPLWSFFSSVKLTIILLILIVILFIAASFLPQYGDARQYVQGLSPAAAAVFLFLRINDLYHSPLFYLLLGMLSVNLIICSINRFYFSWQQFQALPFPEPAGIFDNSSPNSIAIANQDIKSLSSLIEAFLEKKFGCVKNKNTENGIIFSAGRGRFSVFGVYIVHTSILIMIAGGLAGSLFGFKADVNIREGETTDTVYIAGRGMQKLEFAVRCDKFTVEFYDNGAPKTYRSDLSFIREGKVDYQGALLVNHPLTYSDIRFYQSSYGLAPDTKAVLTYTGGREKKASVVLAGGDSFVLRGNNATVQVLRVEEDIMSMGPAVKLRVSSPRKNYEFWVFQHIEEIKKANPGLLSQVPMFNPGLFQPYLFSLERLEQEYFTGLHVVRDPGTAIVALGGILMVIGLFIIYYLPQQRVWVRLESTAQNTVITIAGRTRRNQAALDRRITELQLHLKENLRA